MSTIMIIPIVAIVLICMLVINSKCTGKLGGWDLENRYEHRQRVNRQNRRRK